MKVLYSSIIRAVIAAAVGVLIIKYREDTVHWLMIAIGVLFFISGLISCALYFSAKRHQGDDYVYDAEGKPVKAGFSMGFPIVGLGSIILGIILTLMPSSFIVGLMYALSGILILGAINQYINLGQATRYCRVGLFYWILPTVILIVAILLIVKPIEMFASPLFIMGWCMLLYAVAELLGGIKIFIAWRRRRAMEKAAMRQNEENRKQIEVIPEAEVEEIDN